MKIALLTDSDVFAGTERHILDLAIGLSQIGHSVCIACPKPSALADRVAAAASPGVPIITHVPMQKGKRWDKPAIAILSGLLKSQSVDILHAHNGRTALSAVLAIRKSGVGYCVATQHFISPNRDRQTGIKKWLTSRVHRWVNHHIDQHVAISRAVQQAMIARGDVDKTDISVVLNGIVDPALEISRMPSEVRAEFRMAGDDPLIVCAARLEPEKGIDQLIDVMQAVCKKHLNAKCILAGDGNLKPQLQAIIDKTNLQKNVLLVGFRSDVLSLLRAADVIVLPSAAEPFGLVVVEAMALARPVVAMNCGGPAEIVDHEQTGLLVSPGQQNQLAIALNRLIENPEERKMFGGNGRRRFETDFTVQRMARDMSRVYELAMRKNQR